MNTVKIIAVALGLTLISAVNDYFSIVKFKKGKFKKSATKEARGAFLQQCTSEDEGWINKINSAYGTVRKGF